MHRIGAIYKYLKHFFSARHTGGYGVHSPYIFQFTHFVLKERNSFYIFSTIEKLREHLKKDKRKLSITDFGTGKDRKRTVSSITSQSLKSAKYAQLLFRIAHYFKATEILELGTSLGISTSYLASYSGIVHCVTLEGCNETAQIAQENFKKLKLENIEIIVGDIEDTLEKTLDKFNRLDLVFIDANHKYEAATSYFEKCLKKTHKNTILVIDDIYWSKGMEKAWDYVKNHPKVYSTIDLYQMGIVFFNEDLKKKHYKMRY